MNANIEINTEMTNIINDIGIKMVGNPNSKYYDIRFPFDWALNDIETENGCGPTACFACDDRCINDIFVHYCNKCLHKFVGKRGNHFTSDQMDKDWELWEKEFIYPYMHGVRLVDIGQEEEDYTPFQSAEHMRKYDEATQIKDQDQGDYEEDDYELEEFVVEKPKSVIEHIPYPMMFIHERPYQDFDFEDSNARTDYDE
jgi:hypothetical protein